LCSVAISFACKWMSDCKKTCRKRMMSNFFNCVRLLLLMLGIISESKELLFIYDGNHFEWGCALSPSYQHNKSASSLFYLLIKKNRKRFLVWKTIYLWMEWWYTNSINYTFFKKPKFNVYISHRSVFHIISFIYIIEAFLNRAIIFLYH
jgi:hypothetical protein